MTSRRWVPRVVTLADQVMSSVSNVLVILLVAPPLTAGEFGQFMLGYTILTLTLTVTRTYFGTRISLAPDRARALTLTADLLGTLLVLSPVIFVVVLALSALATGGGSWDLLVVLALAAPVVCIQDIIRFGAAASGRAWAALASDTLWVVVMAVPLLLQMRLSPLSGLSLWALAAVAALAVAWRGIGLRPHWRGGVAELRRRHVVGESVTLGYLGLGVASLWTLAFVGHVIGDAATGSLAGASKAMGPINVLFSYIALAVTPVLVRRTRKGDLRFCALTAAFSAGLVLSWGVLLLSLPDSVGTALLGESWAGVRGVLPWTIAEYAFLAVSAASALGLQVRGHGRALIIQRAGAALVTVIAGCGAAVLTHEVWAVAAALASASLASALLGWAPLWRRLPPPQDTPREPETRLMPLQGA